MIDFLEANSIYIVLVVVLLIWTGLFIFIFKLDVKVSRLEQAIMTKPANKSDQSN